MEIKIDKELRELIPSITADERERLEKSIKEEGCRDPIVLWDETILDGHNRFEICKKHGLDFKTVQKGLDDKEQAKIWIICNQLARRNITKEQRTYLIGLQQKIEKKEPHRPVGKGDQKEPLKTAEKIGKQHGVSASTVKRAEKFAEKVDKLPAEKKAAVLAGKEKIEKPKKEKKQTGKIGIDSDNLMKCMVLFKKLSPQEKAKFMAWVRNEGGDK